MSLPHKIRVETIDGDHHVDHAEPFTFGRSNACSFQVDDSDRNISRVAGQISFDGSSWVLINRSSSRTLHLTDERYGARLDLLPGRVYVMNEGRLRITMVGAGRSHFELVVVVDRGVSAESEDVDEGQEATLKAPVLTESQRRDLAALLWEYHELPSGREPRPRTYEQAAAVLGCTAKALERRVFELRRKLRQLGYPAIDNNHHLAQFLMVSTALREEDFVGLNPSPRRAAREVATQECPTE